jgi:hypothetical protein
MMFALVHLGCYNKVPESKTDIYTFTQSGGWEVQDQGTSRFGIW